MAGSLAQNPGSARRGRGRPRVHPQGTSAARRASLSLANLVSKGGSRVSLRLNPEANKAAGRLAGRTGESVSGLINRLLVEAAK